MIFLAHWMMPMPISSSAPPSVAPSAKFCADQPRNVVSKSTVTYATQKPIASSVATPNISEI